MAVQTLFFRRHGTVGVDAGAYGGGTSGGNYIAV